MSSYVLSPRPLRTALREHGQRASADPVRIEEHSREGRATERVVTGGQLGANRSGGFSEALLLSLLA